MSPVSADPPNAREVERQDDVALGASAAAIPRRRLELDPMPLAIVDRQREHAKSPPRAPAPAHDHRIEPAGEEHDRDFMGAPYPPAFGGEGDRRSWWRRPLAAGQKKGRPSEEGGPVSGIEAR